MYACQFLAPRFHIVVYTYNCGGRIILCIKSAMKYRDGRIKGAGGRMPPQILVDQLTLSQPGRADYALHNTTRP